MPIFTIGVAIFGPIISHLFFFDINLHWYRKSESVRMAPTLEQVDCAVSAAIPDVGSAPMSTTQISDDKTAEVFMG